MSLRILIIDDEPLARARLRALVEELGHEVCAEAGEGRSGEQELLRTQPDVLLLDIEMPGISGIDLAKRFEAAGLGLSIIMVTAHPDYALPAFDAAVTDYILKPVRKERLGQALEKLKNAHQYKISAERCLVQVTLGRKQRLVPLDEISHFSAEGGYVVAHSSKVEACVECSLNELEQRYASALIRVHRSYLAVRSAIAGIETHSAVEHRVLFHDGTAPIPVSRRQLKKVREVLFAATAMRAPPPT